MKGRFTDALLPRRDLADEVLTSFTSAETSDLIPTSFTRRQRSWYLGDLITSHKQAFLLLTSTLPVLHSSHLQLRSVLREPGTRRLLRGRGPELRRAWSLDAGVLW